jgi:hypothetical protein
MKEVRITFASDDFAAVTRHMVDLGIRFNVEPLDAEESSGAAPQPLRPPRAEKTKGAKAKRRGAAPDDSRDAAGAKLRAMVERNRAAARPADQPSGEAATGLPPAHSPFDET